MPSPATPGTAATSPAPARPPTRHGRSSRRRTSRSRCKPGGSSARSATSGARPAGSPSTSPGAELRDVEGLVKLVDRAEIEANDWSLTPGRYVGVAPEEEDEDFDFAGDDAGDSRGAGGTQRRGGDPGGDDQEELRGVGDMTMTARAGPPTRGRSAAMRTGEASETGRGVEWSIVRAKPQMEALNEGPSRTGS